jgi:type II secretory pathway pseudopilin PulG
MHNQQQHLKTNNIISKFAVIVLSIVLLTGLALVPTLQIGVNGQVQQQQQQQQSFNDSYTALILEEAEKLYNKLITEVTNRVIAAAATMSAS